MNSECEVFRTRWLDNFLAGRPAPAGPEPHLMACAACRAELEAWQNAAAAVRRWRIAPAPQVQAATLVRLRQHGDQLRERRRAVQLLAVACTASAAVNAATFRLIWSGAGLLRAWLGWPAAAQGGIFAAWAVAPLALAGLLLWLLRSEPADGETFLEGFHG